jgi:hypothetical protein
MSNRKIIAAVVSTMWLCTAARWRVASRERAWREAAVARDANAPKNACGAQKTFLTRPDLQMISTAQAAARCAVRCGTRMSIAAVAKPPAGGGTACTRLRATSGAIHRRQRRALVEANPHRIPWTGGMRSPARAQSCRSRVVVSSAATNAISRAAAARRAFTGDPVAAPQRLEHRRLRYAGGTTGLAGRG